jgi:hypothetical protein
MNGTGMAIPTRLEGILLYPIVANISNCERGLRVFCCTQQGETYDKARHTI